MSCPFYADYARNCIETFKDVVYIQDFDICTSDSFTDCRFYKILLSKKQPCEFYDHCSKRLATLEDSNLKRDEIFDYIERFCFSEEIENCPMHMYLKGKNKKKNATQEIIL